MLLIISIKSALSWLSRPAKNLNAPALDGMLTIPFPKSPSNGNLNFSQATIKILDPHKSNSSYSVITSSIITTQEPPDHVEPPDEFKTLFSERHCGLSNDIEWTKSAPDDDLEKLTHIRTKNTQKLTAHALSHIGCLDGIDFLEGRIKTDYTYFEEYEGANLRDNSQTSKVIIKELFKEKKRFNFDRFLEVFNQKLAESSARRLAKKLLLFKLGELNSPEHKQAFDYLVSKCNVDPAHKITLPENVTTEDVNKVLSLLNCSSLTGKELRDEIEAILLLVNGGQKELVYSFKELNQYEQNQAEIIENSYLQRVKRIRDSITFSPTAFSYTLKTFDRFLELEDINAFDSPNQFSQFLDQVEKKALFLKPFEPNTVSPVAITADTAEYEGSNTGGIKVEPITQDLPGLNMPKILEEVEKETLEICHEVFKQQKAFIDELNKEQEKVIRDDRRSFNKKVGVGGIATVGIPVLGTLGYLILTHSDQNEIRARELQSQIQRALDSYRAIDFNSIYRAEYNKAKEEMSINLGRGVTIENFAREWNAKIFRRIALLIEPPPSDRLLKAEIENFRTRLAQLIQQFPQDQRLTRLNSSLLVFFNESTEPNRASLAEELFAADIEIRRFFPPILRSLVSRHAIEKKQISGVPQHMIENLTDDLRNIFADDYFAAPLRSVRRIEAIGAGVIMEDLEQGKMLQVLATNNDVFEMPFYRGNLGRNNRLQVYNCWTDIHTRVRNHLITTVNDLKTKASEFEQLLNNFNTNKNLDLDIEENKIRSFENSLLKYRNILNPSYAICLAGFEITEEKAREGNNEIEILPSPRF